MTDREHDDRMRQYRVDALVQARQFVAPGAGPDEVVRVAGIFFEFLNAQNPPPAHVSRQPGFVEHH